MKLFKELGKSFLSFIYPPICLFCEKGVTQLHLPLCEECLGEESFIEPEGRCRICFNPLEDSYVLCVKCRDHPLSFGRLAATCHSRGPLGSLLKQITDQDSLKLAKGLGAHMVVQHQNLRWPLPDCITFIPSPFISKKTVAYLLARAFASFYHKPLYSLFTHHFGNPFHGDFYPILSHKKSQLVTDKVVLVIAESLRSIGLLGKTLDSFLSAYPKRVDLLAFTDNRED